MRSLIHINSKRYDHDENKNGFHLRPLVVVPSIGCKIVVLILSRYLIPKRQSMIGGITKDNMTLDVVLTMRLILGGEGTTVYSSMKREELQVRQPSITRFKNTSCSK
jgi:hypothetical protein